MIIVAFLAILVPLLGGLAGVVYARSSRLGKRAIRDELVQRAHAVSGLLGMEDGGGGPEDFYDRIPEYRELGSRAYFRVTTPEGRVLRTSPSMGDRPFPSAGTPGEDRPVFRNIDGDPPLASVAMMVRREEEAGPVASAGPTFIVEVALDISEARERLRNLALFLIGAGATGMLLGIVVATLVSRRLVLPLQRMSAAAASLSPEEPTRLDRSGIREIDGLARTVNEAFERLAAALARERRFVADASHELRTPAATLLVNAEVGLRKVEEGSAGARTLARQVEVARRLTRLIEDLLVLARSDAGPIAQCMEPVRLHDAIAAAVAAATERLERKRMRVRVEPEEDPGCRVRGVREDLVRVVQNFLSNAIRHGPPDSTVRIRLDCEGDRARIAVSDEGSGIAAEDLPHVFERFYRADQARTGAEGTGLGLAIVQSIARAHGGAVGVESGPGRGTTFRVDLPLLKEDPRASRPDGI